MRGARETGRWPAPSRAVQVVCRSVCDRLCRPSRRPASAPPPHTRHRPRHCRCGVCAATKRAGCGRAAEGGGHAPTWHPATTVRSTRAHHGPQCEKRGVGVATQRGGGQRERQARTRPGPAVAQARPRQRTASQVGPPNSNGGGGVEAVHHPIRAVRRAPSTSSPGKSPRQEAAPTPARCAAQSRRLLRHNARVLTQRGCHPTSSLTQSGGRGGG